MIELNKSEQERLAPPNIGGGKKKNVEKACPRGWGLMVACSVFFFTFQHVYHLIRFLKG